MSMLSHLLIFVTSGIIAYLIMSLINKWNMSKSKKWLNYNNCSYANEAYRIEIILSITKLTNYMLIYPTTLSNSYKIMNTL
jgi:hypothetical protein